MLWKGNIDKELLDYTSSDKFADEILLPYIKSAVLFHASNLHKHSKLTKQELNKLSSILESLSNPIKGEDAHTYILLSIKEKDEILYNKVRAWMSRNEQIVIAELLYFKDSIISINNLLNYFIKIIKKKSKEYKNNKWIAITHFRVAGQYNASNWFKSYELAFKNSISIGFSFKSILKTIPWGTGPGHGTKWNNVPPGYTSIIRSQLHSFLMFYLASISLILSRLSWDLIFFSSDWTKYIELPFFFGSSSMPHKRNPDFFEIIRAENIIIANDLSSSIILHSLPLGYHRDTQKGKEILVEQTEQMKKKLHLFAKIFSNISLNKSIEKDINSFKHLLDSFEKMSLYAQKGKSVEDIYNKYL